MSNRSITVARTSLGWAVSAGDGPDQSYDSKREAVAAARQRLVRDGGQLTVRDARGASAHETILGTAAARRLNAIEGIALDQASRGLLRSLQAAALTPAQRRAEVLRRFKRAAAG